MNESTPVEMRFWKRAAQKTKGKNSALGLASPRTAAGLHWSFGGWSWLAFLGGGWLGWEFLLHHRSFVLAFEHFAGVQLVHKCICLLSEQRRVDGDGFVHVEPLLGGEGMKMKGKHVGKEHCRGEFVLSSPRPFSTLGYSRTDK